MDQAQTGLKCPCTHHKMVPVYLIVLGLLFLLTALDVISSDVTDVIWPVLLILIGLQKLLQSRCNCCGRME